MDQHDANPEHSQEVLDQSKSETNNNDQLVNGNHEAAEQEDDGNNGGLFQITVKLPHDPFTIQVMVSSQEQVQDVRQSIVELPGTFQYSCFHLEHNGERINDYIELSEVKDLQPNSEVILVEDPYTEKEARMHLIRVRELIGAAGNRVDNLHGICAGLSLHDSVAAGEGLPAEANKSHPLDNYEDAAPPNLQTVLPKDQAPMPKTIRAISLSSWNPPPYHLRQKGHLLYLQVTTNEGEQFQITSHVSGFYVNKCSNSKFDPFPRPAPKNFTAHSLLTLISLISPSFNTSFKDLQEFNNKRDLLTTFPFQNSIPNNPWLVPSSQSQTSTHQSDITRSQESYLISGVENSETLRDWNEEFQTTRELPQASVQEKVLRERLTSKLFADYNDAAARGAVLVAKGEVASLNPMEAREAQIFVYNNIFFSYGADSVGTFTAEGGDEAARVAVGKDVMGVKAVNQLDITGLFTPGTVVIDYLGKRLVGQSIVPGIFKHREPGEHQIDYGGVEGKDVIAKNEDFVPVFEKLSKSLRVKKHPVWDKDNVRHDLEGSVETKGLMGTDGRKYVLDLYRVTPLDISWTEDDEGHEPYPHRMSVLRLELVESYWRHKMSQHVKEEVEKRKAAQEAEKAAANGVENGETSEASKKDNTEQARVDISEFKLALNPDVFSGQAPQTEEEKAEWAADEQEVRDACNFLRSRVLPDLIQDLHTGDVGFPMDGQSLGQLLHKRGINIRYLGKVAELAKEKGTRLQALVALVVQDMVTRAFKHIANRYLRNLSTPFANVCLSHLLNCLLGTGVNPKPRAEVDKGLKEIYSGDDFAFEDVTPSSLKADIEKQVKIRYRYTLDENWTENLKHLQYLRDICIKLGIQLAARDFAFHKSQVKSQEHSPVGSTTPADSNDEKNDKKKKKKKGSSSPTRIPQPVEPDLTIRPDDIFNVVPIVKDAAPRSALAEEAFEAGRISLMQNQKELGQELILESLSLHEQIYGILHPEVAKLYHQLSMLYYQTEEKEAAVELARKSVIVTERTMGVDSADAILSYLNLSLFEHATGNTQTALVYIRHALELWKIVYGPNHPDSITTMNNAAVMLQHLKKYPDSRKWFESSLAVCSELFGKQSINAATLLFQLAQALALDQDSKSAVNRMREAYNIFLNELGPEDRNTKEAESWLEQLTQNAVSIAKRAKDIQARRKRLVSIPARNVIGARPQPHAGQTTSDMVQGIDAGNNPSLDSRSIDELLKFIEGGDAARTSGQKKRTARNPKLRGSKQSTLKT
ncbi:Intracellular distribution of mitochondria [Myotisia sp. PD_48]|nr:Intracellular distribution of mitochondria [Myotisia sp. PD_48]